MTFADAMTEQLPVRSAVDVARREQGVRRFMGEFGGVSDDAWARLKATRLLARRDVPAANGRYPLIIGLLRPLSTSITNEFLASHGFVVAMVDGEDDAEPEESGAALDLDYRDMEFAIPELRKRPDVHATALGALGFSGSGFSQILLAMRHPDVAAACDLESAIFDDRVLHPLSRGWGYGVTALRVPFLHTYSVPLSKRENRIADFEAMRYSTRYRYLVDAPGMHHWDFATEGMAASAVPSQPGRQWCAPAAGVRDDQPLCVEVLHRVSEEGLRGARLPEPQSGGQWCSCGTRNSPSPAGRDTGADCGRGVRDRLDPGRRCGDAAARRSTED